MINNVRKLWEGILDVREVRDVFTGKPIITKQYDVDYFIPWSFVMNDELWNLMPVYDSARRQGYEIWNYSSQS